MKTKHLKVIGSSLVALIVVIIATAAVLTNKPEASESEASTPIAYQAEPRLHGHIVPAEISDSKGSPVELPPIVGEEKAVLTYAPEVPPVIRRDHATKVIVDMEVKEVVKELADGVGYTFWTFGGEVPGQFIRVREGDLVEFRLHNHPHNQVAHNIDLHAVTGTGGGAEASLIAPGTSATFSFRALNPGLYVYHCATAPVALHVANGMYGLIFVQPKEGMPEVDREYYVMQSEFYTKGAYMDKGLQPFDQNKAMDENPAYVVFNGGVGAITGENALQASVGEKVRLFVGNAGPNLTSSFHVIGEIFDSVYGEGGVKVNQEQVQTTSIPAGGSATVEFSTDVPGRYTLVDHAIFRAMNKGAVGILDVVGHENKEIFSELVKQEDYKPAASTAHAAHKR